MHPREIDGVGLKCRGLVKLRKTGSQLPPPILSYIGRRSEAVSTGLCKKNVIGPHSQNRDEQEMMQVFFTGIEKGTKNLKF